MRRIGVLIVLVSALHLAASPAAVAVTIPAGYYYGYQATSTSSGGNYYGWLGVDGYISPPNPRLYQSGDLSIACVNMLHVNDPTYGMQWAQTGFAKDDQRTDWHVYMYSEHQDRYGYWGLNPVPSEGEQAGTSAKAFYSYYYGYNSGTGSYVTRMSAKTITNALDEAYFTQAAGRADAYGEVYLATSESSTYATQIGRSWFGSDTGGYALHLYNGNYAWELWDSSLTAGTTRRWDYRTYGYYHSPHDYWYHFVAFGPGN